MYYLDDVYFWGTLRALIYFLLIILFLWIESKRTLHRINYKTAAKRRIFNWKYGAFTYLQGYLFLPLVPLVAAYETQVYQIGLSHWLTMPDWLLFFVWFVTLDLVNYLNHRLAHWSDGMWSFHRVHHSDVSPNITTTFRLHPVTYLIGSYLQVVMIILIGPTVTMVLFAGFISAALLTWSHCNIHIPLKAEQILSQFIACPRYHLLHHRYYECNVNYASGLTVWDKLSQRQIIPRLTDDELGQLKIGTASKLDYDKFFSALIHPFYQLTKLSLHQKLMVVFWGLVISFWLICFSYPKLNYGIVGSHWQTMAIFTLLCYHVNMIVVSVYLNFSEAQQKILYVKALRHVFRFLTWFAVGIDRRHWIGVQRYRLCQKGNKSRIGKFVSIKAFRQGVERYERAYQIKRIKKLGAVESYGWLEEHLYAYPVIGFMMFFVLFIVLFGLWGIPLWTLLILAQIISISWFFIPANSLDEHSSGNLGLFGGFYVSLLQKVGWAEVINSVKRKESD